MNLARPSTRVIAATTAALLTVGAAILTCGAAHAGAPPAGGGGWLERPAGDTSGPVLQTIPLVQPAGRAEAGSIGAGAARATRPFSLIGATWTDPRAALSGTIEVRTRSADDGHWTDWHALESDGPAGADPEGGTPRGSTDPLWVGESDGVEARVTGPEGRTGPLPAGLRLDLINPDEPAATPPAGSPAAPTTESATAPTAGAAVAPRAKQAATHEGPVENAPAARAASVVIPPRPVPRVITRASWAADESIVKNAPEYTTDVQVMFVHHTATGNDYTCSQSASIIRGIEQYHVRSRGWNDIGYNFLVDKCGNLFEGRKGGVDKAVLGAHTLGFNSHSSAIAVIGDYTSTRVPPVVENVIAQVAAYKIGAYGNSPIGQVVLTSSGSDRYPSGTRVTLNRISGHRDTGRTECPGNVLYAQLPEIRGIAGAAPAGLTFIRLAGTFQVGSTYYTRGPLLPMWSLTTPTALMYRFDVLVDGAVVSSQTHGIRQSLVRLTPGSHTVSVRAVHLSGRSSMASARVIADVTPPVFGMQPSLRLRSGSLAARVPVSLYWSVSDAVGLRSVALIKPSLLDLGVSGTPWPTSTTFGTAGTWTIRAGDRAGNTTDASVRRTPVMIAESAAARTGHWRTLTGSGYFGARAMFATEAGAAMTYTFTGSGLGLVVTSNRGTGRVRIYLDGIDKGYVDTRGTTTANRFAVWAGNWSSSGTHTARFVVEGSSGRPAVIMDGIAVLR